MKITVGGSVGMTITNMPYSPIKVESTLLIEKDISEDLDGEVLDNFVKEFNEKLEKFMYRDLESKMVVMANKQKELKRKLENL